MSEIYFVCREDRQMLDKLLGEIPGLIDDLAITICRQDRTGKGGMKISSGSDEQPMPFNVGASNAGDYLRNELNTWARLVCEERYISYDGSDSVVGVSVWLRKNLASLAMTQGAEDALPGIESAMKRCRRAMDIPADDDVAVPVVDVAQARNSELNAAAIARMRHELGLPELNARRIETLLKAGALKPHRVVAMPKKDLVVYRLGDVLDAHEQFPCRQRKMSA
ncbi:hypothetical protein QNA24_22405 [Rhodococcus qingshengii]|uniref:hypothetical protein n=1 Tax=Rhodococcus qingshengii TaxID=334542 RepID=UPI0024B883F0|nr:hypothetical protein [Rhodococcus qingshengii]MDJ0489133.1 hypothetical protein [Rhodococcus qingshengii]